MPIKTTNGWRVSNKMSGLRFTPPDSLELPARCKVSSRIEFKEMHYRWAKLAVFQAKRLNAPIEEISQIEMYVEFWRNRINEFNSTLNS